MPRYGMPSGRSATASSCTDSEEGRRGAWKGKARLGNVVEREQRLSRRHALQLTRQALCHGQRALLVCAPWMQWRFKQPGAGAVQPQPGAVPSRNFQCPALCRLNLLSSIQRQDTKT